MPTVFLSYARADAPRVTALEKTLLEKRVEVWRDQESLYGGQLWPKAIGEAIASHDFFLLAWSSSAASSHFVEFEWTTAIALGKQVIPCLFDATPLPPALKAVEAIDINERDASSRLSAAVEAKPFAPSHDDHVAQVLHRLGDIGTSAPDEVFSQAKAIYAQQGWTVSGNVYQATGNMYVTVKQPGGEQKKSKLETWAKRMAVFASVLGIVISSFVIFDKTKEHLPASSPLRGVVVDMDRQPVADATVEVEQLPGRRQTTTSDGAFVFERVPGSKGDRVRVFIVKPKYKDHNEFVALPGPVRIILEEAK